MKTVLIIAAILLIIFVCIVGGAVINELFKHFMDD